MHKLGKGCITNMQIMQMSLCNNLNQILVQKDCLYWYDFYLSLIPNLKEKYHHKSTYILAYPLPYLTIPTDEIYFRGKNFLMITHKKPDVKTNTCTLDLKHILIQIWFLVLVSAVLKCVLSIQTKCYYTFNRANRWIRYANVLSLHPCWVQCSGAQDP